MDTTKVTHTGLTLKKARSQARRCGVRQIFNEKSPFHLRGVDTDFSDLSRDSKDATDWSFSVSLTVGQTWVYSRTLEECTITKILEMGKVEVSWDGWKTTVEAVEEFNGGRPGFFLKK